MATLAPALARRVASFSSRGHRGRGFAGLGPPQETKLFPGVKRTFELIVDSGKGCEVWTTEGKRYLDATAGVGVLSTGHCHPTVVKAVQEQATKLTHAMQSCYYNSPGNALMEKLASVVPQGHDSFFFANSGAEAVEGALRLARQATGRDNIVAFLGGYHGRTSGCLAITSSAAAFRGDRAGPLPSGTLFARYPTPGVTVQESFESLELLLLQQSGASDIAAVIIEPVLGEGGYVVPPKGYLKSLREWCTSKDILLIADEVQTGYGRTGKHWAIEHEGVVPDILISAKGIASGYPLAMVTSTKRLTSKQKPGSMGGTYGGNAVACAAAAATLDVFNAEGTIANAEQRGKQLMDGLHAIASKDGSPIADVRGLGLMVGVEFDQEIAGKGYAAKVVSNCFDRGMLVLMTGHRETIRFIPPLVVTSQEIDEMLSIFEQATSRSA